jgi:hypothetical protein
MMAAVRNRGVLLAALVALAAVACRAGDVPVGGLHQPLSLRAALTFRPALKTQAVAADIHHVTFRLVNASDLSATAAVVEAQPPFTSPMTLQLPAPGDGSYRLTVEAFGGAAATSSLTQGGVLPSLNRVTVTGNVPAYSTGTAIAFPSLQLKSGGIVPATVTGTNGNQIDVSIRQGATTLSTTAFSPTSFSVDRLAPGTYVLRAVLYTAPSGGIVDRTVDSAPVTVGGAATGYAADGTFEVAF